MQIDDMTLIAYLDGELETDDQYEEVENALARDPGLRVRLHALVDSGERIRRAFDAKLEEAVPPRLIEAIFSAPLAAPSPAAAPAVQAPETSWIDRLSGWLGPALALASVATLALGVLIGQSLLPRKEGGAVPPLAAVVGEPVRDAALAVALEAAPSGRALAVGEARLEILASFEDVDGRFCREFGRSVEVPAARDEIGVACREDRGSDGAAALWRIAFHAEAAAAAADGYGTASDSLHQAADEFLAGRLAGEMMDVERERALLEKGWQR